MPCLCVIVFRQHHNNPPITSLPKKRKKGHVKFKFHGCKEALKKDHKCTHVMCTDCMIMWMGSGRRYSNQPSDDEVAAAKQKRAEKVASGVNVPTRVSRRPVNPIRESTKKFDENGCAHSCSSGWMENEYRPYFQPKWRNAQGSKKVLSLKCIDCKHLILPDV